jgi:hypothetical protein
LQDEDGRQQEREQEQDVVEAEPDVPDAFAQGDAPRAARSGALDGEREVTVARIVRGGCAAVEQQTEEQQPHALRFLSQEPDKKSRRNPIPQRSNKNNSLSWICENSLFFTMACVFAAGRGGDSLRQPVISYQYEE